MNLSPGMVIEKVKDAGVVGAGGAGFPTYIKLNSKVKTVIANAASCEPLVNSDFSIIEQDPEKLLKAMSLVVDITEADEGIIALKGKHKKLVKLLEKAIKEYSDNRVKLFKLDDFYPAGDEFILVYEVTGKVIPERSLPLEVGCLVHNVTTLIQVYDAVESKPVISRIVTVAGEVNKPCDFLLPIGTSFKAAIDLAGGPTVEDFRVIHGGPMMGKLVEDIEKESITKTTGLILVLPYEHPIIQTRLQPLTTTLKRSKSVCCQCSMCSTLCPRGLIGHPLLPHKIMRTIAYNLSEPAENVTSAYLCSECGLCSIYSCTMGLLPHKVNIEIKNSLARNKFQFQKFYDDYKVDNEVRNDRKVPTHRLVSRLGLSKYIDVDISINLNEYIPESVNIKLLQHIGSSASPTVKIGDKVKRGDLIADISDKKLGAKIHASIDGKIVEISYEEIVIKG